MAQEQRWKEGLPARKDHTGALGALFGIRRDKVRQVDRASPAKTGLDAARVLLPSRHAL